MIVLIYLVTLGRAVIMGAIVSILTGIALSTLTSLSPLIIGGIVGAISVAPLITTFIKILLLESAVCNDFRISNLTLKEVAYLAGLFVGSVAIGVGIGSVTPIVKVDSLLSLSTTMSSLLITGVVAPVLPIVAAIGIAIALNKIKKLTRPPEKEPSQPTEEKPSQLTEEELQNLSNELKEVDVVGSIRSRGAV